MSASATQGGHNKGIKTCNIGRYDSGAYTITQFLRAVGHRVGAHNTVVCHQDSDSDHFYIVIYLSASGACYFF